MAMAARNPLLFSLLADNYRGEWFAVDCTHQQGVARELVVALLAVMAHESDAASKVYERDGDRSKQADKAVRALNRSHGEKSTERT